MLEHLTSRITAVQKTANLGLETATSSLSLFQLHLNIMDV